MNLLRAWFLSRLLREKVLVLAFVGLGALIWLSSATSALTSNLRGFRSVQSELELQAMWLGKRAEIEAIAVEESGKLDAAKTFDATGLVSEVSGMAKRSGLNPVTEPPRTERSPQFAVHTMQVSMRKVEMQAVVRFYQELARKAPYLGLEKISVQADRSAPGMLNITMQVTSVELLGAVAEAAVANAKPVAAK